MSVPVFTQEQVRAAITLDDALHSARRAFHALDAKTVTSPHPWHLDLPDGAVHVKGGAIGTDRYFAVKASTGFPGNASQGLPTSDGLTMVFDSVTGLLAAVLLDGGYLTELRTGAAGAMSIDLLAREDTTTIACIGTGGQARYQLAAALCVRTPTTVIVYGRTIDRAEQIATWVSNTHNVAACGRVLGTEPVNAEVIITVTGSTTPLLTPNQGRCCKVGAVGRAT